MSRVRGQIIEYVDGEELSLEVCACPAGPCDDSPPLHSILMPHDSPLSEPKQEPPYKAIFLAFALLVIGTVLLICGSSVVTGYVDAKA